MDDLTRRAREALVDVTPGPWKDFIDDSSGQWTGWPLSIDATSIEDKCVVRTGGKWKSPIHMPRWASRLTLVVTDVRVQRLHSINEADAIREGVTLIEESLENPRDAFVLLWNSIHGPEAWALNPWVAALTFTVHRCNIDQMPGGNHE